MRRSFAESPRKKVWQVSGQAGRRLASRKTQHNKVSTLQKGKKHKRGPLQQETHTRRFRQPEKKRGVRHVDDDGAGAVAAVVVQHWVGRVQVGLSRGKRADGVGVSGSCRGGSGRSWRDLGVGSRARSGQCKLGSMGAQWTMKARRQGARWWCPCWWWRCLG